MSDVEMACSSAYSGRFPAPSLIKCETTAPPQARNPSATHNSILADGSQDYLALVLLSENLVLKSNLSQAQYAVAIERFHNSEARRIQDGKDELIAALRQELSLHRDHTKTTKEQQRQITRALLTVVHAPDSDMAHSLVKEAYQEQLKENENLRVEIGALSGRADRKNQVQVPMLYSGVAQASSSTHAAGPLGSTNQVLLPQQQQPRVDTEEAVVPSTTKSPKKGKARP
ncbi:hypothetical protein LTR78_009332 [Recurvomyces mirabilis]|uniref:Uncharacterized protein n=1 Tax=Recurvomyces mirabilis TaxID=574656 RepID=A0AAE0TPI1_9PEZI|nr:hypothetical protein LTR78_009332 [Recurvomyces mirabilis]